LSSSVTIGFYSPQPKGHRILSGLFFSTSIALLCHHTALINHFSVYFSVQIDTMPRDTTSYASDEEDKYEERAWDEEKHSQYTPESYYSPDREPETTKYHSDYDASTYTDSQKQRIQHRSTRNGYDTPNSNDYKMSHPPLTVDQFSLPRKEDLVFEIWSSIV
jgi:hypothetical protein